MQTDSTGFQQQQVQDIQSTHLSREQEIKMDTSDDRAVERQLLGDLPSTHHHQEATSTSTNSISAVAADSINQSYSTAMTSLDMSKDEFKVPLPPSEYDLLCEAVETVPYSSLGWNALIEHSERSKDMEKISRTYDRLLDTFPNTVRSDSLAGYTCLPANGQPTRFRVIEFAHPSSDV
jgi:hypothetical protein